MTLDEIKAGIRELWSAPETLSTREIGARLGVTKNVVVGHAHRMNLPPRPSPIRRRPPVVAPQTIYSQSRGEWLCQNAFAWSDDPAHAGVWSANTAGMVAATIAQIHEPVVADVPEERLPELPTPKRGPGRTEVKRTLSTKPVHIPLPVPTPSGWKHPRGCQWHLGREGLEHLFCGEPAEAGSWCAAHAVRVFAPRKGLANAA